MTWTGGHVWGGSPTGGACRSEREPVKAVQYVSAVIVRDNGLSSSRQHMAQIRRNGKACSAILCLLAVSALGGLWTSSMFWTREKVFVLAFVLRWPMFELLQGIFLFDDWRRLWAGCNNDSGARRDENHWPQLRALVRKTIDRDELMSRTGTDRTSFCAIFMRTGKGPVR